MGNVKSIKMNLKITYESINLFLFFILVFFTPTVLSSNTNELYEFPKMFFIYILGSTIIFLFLLRKIFQPQKFILPDIFVLIFLTANVLSTVFSSHLYTSVWGYYTRFNGGLISTLIYFGIYFVAINTLKVEDFKKLIILILISLIPISTYGVFQHFELTGSARIYSTFGQPNWLAAYIDMLLPFLLVLIFSNSKGLFERINIFWIIIYLVSFLALWFTYSMSGLMGFVAGTFFTFILNRKTFFASSNKTGLKNNLIKFFVILLFSFTVAIFNLGFFENRAKDTIKDFKKFISYQTRVYAQETVYDVSDAGFIRKGLWSGTLNLIFSNTKIFLLGTGPETFPYEFQKFRPKELNHSSEWNFIFNNAHNYYLETWSQLGLVGLASYLMIALKILKKMDTKLTPVFIALYVTNLFSWPTVATSVLFWFFLGYFENKQ